MKILKINDLNGELINLYNVMKNSPEEIESANFDGLYNLLI